MVWIPVKISVSMCRFSIHCGVISMVGVRGVLSGPGKGMLLSQLEHSMVNLMWVSIWFVWLNRMSTWSFIVIQVTSSSYPSHQGVGMGHWGPITSSSKYSMSIFAMTGETGDPISVPWSHLSNLCSKENTQLFKKSSRIVIILSLGMLWECSKKFCKSFLWNVGC